jgi:amidase
VPIAIKNNRAVAGRRLTLGAELMGDHAPAHDHNVTRRLREAGFVIVGTTAMPEWGILPVTEGRRQGPTRNPGDLQRTPGGSSGGSAAAVAAGMVPLAHGNDGGGSLRIPAACCGLVGLKPQRGRISHAPDSGEQFLVQDGVLTRTVRETALLLDVLAGTEVGDATWAPEPAEPFAAALAREPATQRIGVTTLMPLLAAPLDPACERAAHDAAALLETLGHEVEEVQPPWHRPALLDLFTRAFGPAICSSIAGAAQLAGRPPRPEDMEAVSWEIWQTSTRIDAVEAEIARRTLQSYARAVTRWAAPYDALLTPALAQPPLPIGTLDPCGPDPAGTFERSGHFTPYTAISNVTGSPAISLPLYAREDGLPLAVQLIGRPAQEGALLALAAQIEAAAPWADRRATV